MNLFFHAFFSHLIMKFCGQANADLAVRAIIFIECEFTHLEGLMVNVDVTVANRDLTLLAPVVQRKLASVIAVCHEIGYPIVISEGYRTPARQDWLYEQGRTRSGPIVTKKRAWGSFHQIGTALDVAFIIDGTWSWDKDLPWEKTAKIFQDHGFSWLFPFEKAHFQITAGMSIYDAAKIYQSQGKESCWQKMGLV